MESAPPPPLINAFCGEGANNTHPPDARLFVSQTPASVALLYITIDI
jgi:hypothetical protein